MAASNFSIEQFLNIRSATGPTFSSDGRTLAFLTNITGVPQLWQMPVEGGWPTQLSFTSESVRGAWYCPTHHELIFSMDKGGNERTQLYRLAGADGGMNHDLGEGWTASDISQDAKAVHLFGGWNHAGDQIALSANREQPDRFDIYIQKLGEKPRLAAKGPGGYYVAAGWSPDDRYLLIHHNESNFNQDIYALEVATNKIAHLTPHQGEVQYHSPQWSGDGKTVFCVSTHGGRDLAGLAQIDVTSSRVSFADSPNHEVEAVAGSRRGRWLAWLVNVDGKSELHLRDMQAGVTHDLGGLPLGVISQLVFAPDETRLAFVFDGPRHNPDVWVADLAENRLAQVTRSSRAGIPFSSFVEPELIRYKTFDGKSIPAWFYAPARPATAGRSLVQPGAGALAAPAREGTAPGTRLPPVIVYPHGGPEGQTRPNFNAVFQFFLQHGYGILAPNVRGSTGYGTNYMNLDNTTKRMDSVKDLAHAVHWLRDNKKADPKRIAVFGGSYGGFMVLAAVTNYPDLFAAGIDVVGIANFVTFLENTGAYRRAHREAEYGNLRDHRKLLEEISPIHHVDKIQCPMMVIHGANDPRVPIGEAEQIVAALKKRNIPVDYLRYEDEGHGLAKLKNRLDAYPKMVAFLDKYLK
jgi:dipeptidyl aminopeptidase/acylaminoacyl peptidase